MSHEDERWARLEMLFHACSALPPSDRLACLRGECSDDPSLFEEVAALLASESEVIDRDLAASNRMAASGAEEANTVDPMIGRRVGAFLIEAQIGEGGMGVVYRGERQDEFSQAVAIKLMAFARPSPSLQERFLRERDTLAALQHRHIVRLLDGGVTEDGLPYIVMEFIRGRRIDAVCDEPSTSVLRVLELMLQVCDAVSYVHRNLLLHRDLKPSNVLVTDVALLHQQRQAEIKQLHFSSRGHQNVLRLQVRVNDKSAVGILDRIRNLQQQRQTP